MLSLSLFIAADTVLDFRRPWALYYSSILAMASTSRNVSASESEDSDTSYESESQCSDHAVDDVAEVDEIVNFENEDTEDTERSLLAKVEMMYLFGKV